MFKRTQLANKFFEDASLGIIFQNVLTYIVDIKLIIDESFPMNFDIENSIYKSLNKMNSLELKQNFRSFCIYAFQWYLG